MEIPVEDLPLSTTHCRILLEAGFMLAGDISELSAVNLASELNISREDAMCILKVTRGITSNENTSAGVTSSTAFDMLQKERHRVAISTGSQSLNQLLCPVVDGNDIRAGVQRSCITEFSGAPGLGKTQLGLQLSVNTRMPVEYGGAGGNVLYIDTEGSFVVERIAEMAYAAISANPRALEHVSVDNILAGIHYFRVHNHLEQLALLHQIPNFMKTLPNVCLVVIDSIAFHFRASRQDMSVRARLLHQMANSLTAITQTNACAVVIINQMTTRIRPGDSSNGKLVPALGDSWGHVPTHRIKLYWERGRRFAAVTKSSSLREGVVEYSLVAAGVRDP
eukprot:CFRG2949T1